MFEIFYNIFMFKFVILFLYFKY